MFEISDKPSVGLHSIHAADGSLTFTLTTYLGHLLFFAENLLGQRDKTWTILGIEFYGDGPEIWYPNPQASKYAVVRLSESALQDPKRAIFQLAHETIHLISPSGGRNALVFEEGLATAFSHDICRKLSIGYHSNIASYLDAEKLIREMIKIDQLAIKKAREIEPRMWMITPEILMRACPEISVELANRLCTKFVR